MPPFRSDESLLTYLEQLKAKREARTRCVPMPYPMELHDVDAKIAELQRVRARLIESHGLVHV